MKNKLLYLFFFLTLEAWGQGTPREIVGTVLDKETGDTLPRAQVFVIDQDRKYHVETGLNGRFSITAVPAGDYALNIKFALQPRKN